MTLTPVEVTGVEVITPVDWSPQPKLPRGVSLFLWNEAQDCHTRSEEQLRLRLWTSARDPGSDDVDRRVELPFSDIVKRVSLSESATRIALRGLVEKLAVVIEQEYYEGGRPRIYRIRSFKNLNAERRKAGLLWCYKRGGGITLLTGDRVEAIKMGSIPVISAPVTRTPVRGLEPTGLTAVEDTRVAPVTPTPRIYIETNSTDKETSSPESLAAIVAQLNQTMGHVDHDAARRMIEACRQQTPDATAEEIVHFIGIEGSRLRRMRGIENPMGLLIRQVPRCFEGETLRQFREAERQRREADNERRRQSIAEANSILNDPNTSEQDKQWAMQILELLDVIPKPVVRRS